MLAACGHSNDSAIDTTAPNADKIARKTTKFTVPVCVEARCGVLNQDAQIVVPFDGDAESVVDFPMQGTQLVNRAGEWQLLDAGTMKPIKAVGEAVYEALPGYFGFRRNGKVGLMDFQGREVQSPQYDTIYPGGAGTQRYIGFDVAGKHGLLDSHGRLVAEANYDSIEADPELDEHGGLLFARRDDQVWLIDLKTGRQNAVDYDELSSMSDGHMTVSYQGVSMGLVDEHGTLVIPMEYDMLGQPSEGLLAFRRKQGGACGYMDYRGHEVIIPKFMDCQPFGKRGALAASRQNDEQGESAYVYSLIDRTGAALSQYHYARADKAGYTQFGNVKFVPGYSAVYSLEGDDDFAHVGLFDVNGGREIVHPTFLAAGVLTHDRYVYTMPSKLPLKEQEGHLPPAGLLGPHGKSLVKAETYQMISLDQSGRYLHAMRMEDRKDVLLDLDGHVLIDSGWDTLEVNESLGVIFGYDVLNPGDYPEQRRYRAAYDLSGKALFTVRRTGCGDQQLVNGRGEPIWPKVAELSCAGMLPGSWKSTSGAIYGKPGDKTFEFGFTAKPEVSAKDARVVRMEEDGPCGGGPVLRVNSIPLNDPMVEPDFVVEFDKDDKEIRRWGVPYGSQIAGMEGDRLIFQSHYSDDGGGRLLWTDSHGLLGQMIYPVDSSWRGLSANIQCPALPAFEHSHYVGCHAFSDLKSGAERHLAWEDPCT